MKKPAIDIRIVSETLDLSTTETIGGGAHTVVEEKTIKTESEPHIDVAVAPALCPTIGVVAI
jgi:hypothetical protein